MAFRAASHRIGGSLLQKLLNADGGGYQGTSIDCGKGHRARFVEYRAKEVVTVLSPAKVTRAYYHCDPCGEGVTPKDVALRSEERRVGKECRCQWSREHAR